MKWLLLSLSLALLLACKEEAPKNPKPVKQVEETPPVATPTPKASQPAKEEFPEFIDRELNAPAEKGLEEVKTLKEAPEKLVVEKPAQKKTSVFIRNFLENVNSLKKVEAANPIEKFQAVATAEASKKMSVNKGNIQEVLSLCGKYEACVITTENHTIMKVSDVKDCKQSGAWAACMPRGKGFIKKGELQSQSDYLNNVIGIPDAQKRTVWFF